MLLSVATLVALWSLMNFSDANPTLRSKAVCSTLSQHKTMALDYCTSQLISPQTNVPPALESVFLAATVNPWMLIARGDRNVICGIFINRGPEHPSHPANLTTAAKIHYNEKCLALISGWEKRVEKVERREDKWASHSSNYSS
jgi:hypothetical protein